MYSYVVALMLVAAQADVPTFPDYEEAKACRQLAKLAMCMRDNDRMFRRRAWDLLAGAYEAPNVEEAIGLWEALHEFLDDWDRANKRKRDSFQTCRMPHPCPPLRWLW
jgi:hypothetical protein